MTHDQREAFKTIAWGVVWFVGVGALWLNTAGNPIHDLRLALGAKVAQGLITDTWQDAVDGDDGEQHWSNMVAYRFTLPDGREIKSSESGSSELRPELVDLKQPVPAEVEYLASAPAISRLKGSGSQSFTEWLVRKVGFGGLFLVLFLAPGVKLIRTGLAELRRASAVQL